jgi:F-type H+-transporting ATPase subunit epsilon
MKWLKSIEIVKVSEMAETQENIDKKKLTLTITTPRGVKFVEEADMVIMRTIDGNMGVLPGHAPVSTTLGDGVLRIMNNGFEKQLAVFGGHVNISDNAINLFSTIAQRPDEIDVARAEEDRKEALAAVEEEIEENMTKRLELMQFRALVRLRVSQNEFFEDEDESDDEDED